MLKNIIVFLVVLFIFGGCGASNLLKFGELDKAVAQNDKPVRNLFNDRVLSVDVPEDIEDLSIYLPKKSTTVRLKLNIANIEDVLYMKLTDESDFNVNKLLKRVSDIEELGLEQDGFMFEPSVQKDVIILQIYVPSIYLYDNSYEPMLTFSFKRSSRAVQEKIKFYFVRQYYYVTNNEEDQEVPAYGNLAEYCEKVELGAPQEFTNELEKLNQNRVGEEFRTKLQGICQ
jgi:hypothetical protein